MSTAPGTGEQRAPGRTPGPDPGWTGAWAADAQRLFRMMQQAASDSRDDAHSRDDADGADGTDSAAGPAAAPPHATAAECRYCPVCQGLAMIRRSGPEVLDKVAEFAAGLAATLRAADRERPPPWDGDAAAPVDLTAQEPPHEIPVIPPAVRIDITD